MFALRILLSAFIIYFAVFPVLYPKSEADQKDIGQEMSVVCAVVSGRIKNPARCVELQRLMLEERCRKGNDPNACKALEVAKAGKDPEGERLVRESEDKAE